MEIIISKISGIGASKMKEDFVVEMGIRGSINLTAVINFTTDGQCPKQDL